MFTAVNAIAGHELLHSKKWYNKTMGTFAYTKFFYSSFVNEHIEGHHKNVATNEDPATARKNEMVWTFIFRSVIGSHWNTWNREVDKIKRRLGKETTCLQKIVLNKMTLYFIIHASILGLIYYTLGLSSVKHQMCYAAFGFFWLESINYVEHYGLQRMKDKNGIYEPVSPLHSWNSLSSTIQFRLQRHSDHHSYSFRPYQILRRFDDAPYTGFDYIHTLLIAYCPPVFFYCINPRVDAVREYQNGRDRKGLDSFDNLIPMTGRNKSAINAGYIYLILM